MTKESDYVLKYASPIRSKLRVHSPRSWEKKQKSENLGVAIGVYQPRILEAHVQEKSPFLQVDIWHEYIGHGGFCEHSQIGINIVKMEQELSRIETLIPKLRKEKKTIFDNQHESFREFKNLYGKLQEYTTKYHNYFEAYAHWLEFEFSKENDVEPYRIKEKRIHPYYITLRDICKRTVNEKGIEYFMELLKFS